MQPDPGSLQSGHDNLFCGITRTHTGAYLSSIVAVAAQNCMITEPETVALNA